MINNTRKKNRRQTLKILGNACWVTPIISASTLPAHAQTSGQYCGGMEGVAGVWLFRYGDALDPLALYPDGSVVRLDGDRIAKWSIAGAEVRIFDFDAEPSLQYIGTLNSDCASMTGTYGINNHTFEATKSDQPLP